MAQQQGEWSSKYSGGNTKVTSNAPQAYPHGTTVLLKTMYFSRGLLGTALLQVYQHMAQAMVFAATTLSASRIEPRDSTLWDPVTCGYRDGDPAQAWLAPSGYDCRVDTSHGIWGFCPTTVIAATDCGLGGYCFDTNTCTSGCGKLSNNPAITTWTWYIGLKLLCDLQPPY
jgi:hypothetical protein